MSKWADYLISEAEYDSNYLISKIKQHRDNGESISDGEIIDRSTLANNLGHGSKYMTVYGALNKLRIGKNVRYFRADGYHYIRIDHNKVNHDNLGDLPDISKHEQEEKPALASFTKPKPIDETKPLSVTSSAFFAEPAEVAPEPAEVAPEPAEVAPEPAEVAPEPAEVAPEPKKAKMTVTKRKPAAKRKAVTKRKPAAKRKAVTKRKPAAKRKAVTKRKTKTK